MKILVIGIVKKGIRKMKNFVYPVKIEMEDGAKVLSCRDIPQANAFTYDENIEKTAREMLTVALQSYMEMKEPIPSASKPKKGETVVSLNPSFILKVILHNAMLENRIRSADLARKLDIPTSEVARITNYKVKTKIDTMSQAINACGEELVLSY